MKLIKDFLNVIAPQIPRVFYRLIPGFVLIYLKEKFYKHYLIDIIGSCNLACPSCPSGGVFKNRGGKMKLDMFEKIIKKISAENPGTTVGLFNWTDPLVHPEVEKFIDIIHDHNLSAFISTNLNLVRNMEALVATDMERIRISLSGFSQEIYSIGHRTGDVEIVKDNMRKLREAMRKTNSKTKVEVYFHKYNYNLHEIEKMKAFANDLGFYFFSDWAIYMPVERIVDYVEGRPHLEDKDFIETRYALDLGKAIEETKPYRHEECHLKGAPITIDCRGDVMLCCSVYDAEKFSVGSYLDSSAKELKKKIDTHSYCGECMSKGCHIYVGAFAHKINKTYENMAEAEMAKRARSVKKRQSVDA